MIIPPDTEVGICSDCGLITADQVNLNFPNPPTCDDCGSELEKATVTTEETEVQPNARQA